MASTTAKLSADKEALWASTCGICRRQMEDHVGLRPATNQPFCPIIAEGNDLVDAFGIEAVTALAEGKLDGTSFESCSPSDCESPTTHEVGCDCQFGYC